MTDQQIHDLFGGLDLSASPGLADRVSTHVRAVASGAAELPSSPIALKAVAGSVAVVAVMAAGGVVVLQRHTAAHLPGPAQQAPPAAAVAGPSDSASAAVATASSTRSAAPSASAQAVASATAQASAPPPVADCTAADLRGSVAGGGTYAAGQQVSIHETVTNISSHPCQIPWWCTYSWKVLDGAGQQVGSGPMAASCPVNAAHDVLAAGASVSSPPSQWSTQDAPAGHYSIHASLDGLASASADLTVVAAQSSTSTTTTSTSSSSSSSAVLP